MSRFRASATFSNDNIPEAFRRLIGLMWLSFGEVPPSGFHPSVFVSTAETDAELTRLVMWHGVLPWLFNHAEALDQWLCAETIQSWRQHYTRIGMGVLVNTSWTIRLVRALQEAGIRCLPIKGVSAAVRYYGSVTGRVNGDVDLMVLPADIDKAHALFLNLGFKPKFPYRALNPAEMRWVQRCMHHFTFIEPKSGLLIELHWALHDNRLLGLEDREWPGIASEQVTVGNHPLPALDRPTDYLLLLTHAGRSGWSKMKWLLDVQQAWTALSPEQREQVQDRIRALNLEPAQDIFTRLAAVLFGPDPEMLERPLPSELAFLYDASSRHSLVRKYRHVCNLYRLRNDRAYRWDTLRLYLSTWSDIRLLCLPSWAFPLYLPLRIPLLGYRRVLNLKRDD